MPDYVDIAGPNGTEDNIGGTTQRWWFAPRRDFAVIGELSAAPATMGELAEITTDHTFLTGKKFNVGYSTRDTGQINDEKVGERDGRGIVSKMTFLVPGTKAEVLGFVRQGKNDQFIVLGELADGTVRQLGSARFGADITANGKSGTNSTGVRGWEVEVESFEVGPMIYSGVISTTPAP